MTPTPLSSQTFFDVPEVARRLGVSTKTIRRLIARGEIGFARVSGVVRIPEESLEAYLRTRFVEARPVRQDLSTATIEKLLDKVVPRRRGRPRVGTSERPDQA